MVDYYPLIARAVAGLDKNTGGARRALYERARATLVAQLRGVTPALDESGVTRERLALEEAIRKVEGESARQSTSHSEPALRAKAPEFPRWDEPEPEPAPEARQRPRTGPADPLAELAKLIGQSDVFTAERKLPSDWRETARQLGLRLPRVARQASRIPPVA